MKRAEHPTRETPGAILASISGTPTRKSPMAVDLVSLAIIALVAAIAPILARLIPGKVIPETVFLLIAGAVLGPYLLGFIHVDETVSFLSDLGLSFLFLLAGYEIDTKNLTGSQGKRGLATWVISLALAFAVIRLIPGISISHIDGIAIAIALTTTALGTLLPIMKERNLMGTPIGNSILSYGTWGELGPVIAMALLLSTRQTWQTMALLLAFVAFAVLTAVFSSKARKAGSRMFAFLSEGAETTSQTIMRVTILLLVSLVALSALFDLDIVLGSFAAGFVLRYIIPEGNTSLETKLDGIAYGFFIPLFFIVSGANIDLTAVFDQPVLLVGFIVMLLLIRTTPIFIALSTGKDTKTMTQSSRVSIALYCTTALPLIVAVTSVAVKTGAMDQSSASVLVSAGALTVFLMPLLAALAQRLVDVEPLKAAKEISQHPDETKEILRDHLALERMLAKAKKHAEDMTDVDNPSFESRLAQRAAAAKAAHTDRVARRFAAERRRRLAEQGREVRHDDEPVSDGNGADEKTKPRQ